MASTKAVKAGRAFVELFTDNTKLVKGLRLAEAKVKAFGARISNIGARVSAAGAALAAPFAASVKYFSSYGDQVAKMAKRTGLSIETLSELRFVASQTGTEFASLEMAFRKMQRSIYDAGRGLSTQVDALTDLGLTFDDLKHLSPEEQFKKLAGALGTIKDDTKQAAIAMMLFGRTGTNLIPMFEAGAEGIAKLQAEARRLGLTMSKEDAKAAEDLTDAFDALWKSVKMVSFQIGAALAGNVQNTTEALTEVTSKTIRWIKANQGLIVSAAKITGAIVATGAAMLATGIAIKALAFSMGILVTAVSAVTSVLGLLSGVIMAINSPMMLIGAAVGVTVAALVALSEAGQGVLGNFSKIFKSIGNGMHQAMGIIADAVANGRLDVAFEVAWAAIKVSFAKLISELKKSFSEFKAWYDNIILEHATKLEQNKIDQKLKEDVSQIELQATADHVIAKKDVKRDKAQAKKDYENGLLDEDLYKRKLAVIDELAEKQREAIELEKNKKLAALVKPDREARENLDNAVDSVKKENEATKDKKITDAENELSNARAKYAAELFAASRELEDMDLSINGRDIKAPDASGLDFEDALKNINLDLSKDAVAGTFNSAAVSGMGAGGMLAQINEHNAKIRESNEAIKNNTKSWRGSGAKFSR